MGKNKINFHVIWNEEYTDSYIGTSMKDVLNAITCDQFCKAVRRAVHLSIQPREYVHIPDIVMKEIREEIFPAVSIKYLTSKYHYWRSELDDNTLGYSIAGFYYSCLGQSVYISLIIDFRIENHKMVAHTEYCANYEGKEYRRGTIEDITTAIYGAISEEKETYRKLKNKYDPAPASKKVSHKAAKKLKSAAPMTMEELERACALEPDGTYDNI